MGKTSTDSPPGELPGPLDFPELVIGVAGPIGVDLNLIASVTAAALGDVAYTSSLIKLTSEISSFSIRPELKEEIDKFSGPDTFHLYMRKMSEANALRKQYADASILGRIGIRAIRRERALVTGSEEKPRPKHAYIIRQFKRPEEISLLRTVYGRQFVLISAYAPTADRKTQLFNRLKHELATATSDTDISYMAERLMARDSDEHEEKLGQKLRDTFHLADVFIDGLHKGEMEKTIKRFVDGLFGRNDISPSKDEYGMYAARSASLRSADLSRQIGAALFTHDGELVTQGCNEVPKAHGGTYWDLEYPDHRDITKGFDPNERFKKEILRDLIERFRKKDYLSENLLRIGNESEIIDELVAVRKDEKPDGILVGSSIMDLTEFGRVVHAEMSALCDAARTGRSVKGTTLFCTTFPCHNCTKHILASGVTRVVYMEPYPKSKAKDLHPDEIELEGESEAKVSFVPFMGISPFRYRDIFQKGRRKDEKGNALPWYRNERRPLMDTVFPSYVESELWALLPLVGEVTRGA